jgi:hypothetical protein
MSPLFTSKTIWQWYLQFKHLELWVLYVDTVRRAKFKIRFGIISEQFINYV